MSAASRPLLSASLGALALVVAACGGAPSRTELAEALEASGVSAEVAECAADALTDSLSEDQLAELTVRGPGAAPIDDPDDPDDAADRLREAMGECRDLALAEDTSTATTTTVAGADTTTSVVDSSAPSATVDPDGATLDTSEPEG